MVPAPGVLTRFLLENPLVNLTAIELDSESVEFLHENYPNLKVIEGDFLKIDLQSIFSDKFMIIGNLPYNISSQIFFKMLENKDSIPCLVGMIQKEVAERMAAKSGSKNLRYFKCTDAGFLQYRLPIYGSRTCFRPSA